LYICTFRIIDYPLELSAADAMRMLNAICQAPASDRERSDPPHMADPDGSVAWALSHHKWWPTPRAGTTNSLLSYLELKDLRS